MEEVKEAPNTLLRDIFVSKILTFNLVTNLNKAIGNLHNLTTDFEKEDA